MEKLKRGLYTIAFGALCTFDSNGQGCSDAGFCTINALKPNSTAQAAATYNQVKAGAFFGNGDQAVSAYGLYVEYNKQVNRRFGFDARLTTLAQSGNGIAVMGLSDFFATANYNITDNVKLTLGTKIPLSAANKRYNNLPLPMDYQSSLGTWDAIVGIGFAIKKVQINVALQQPLTDNKNQFLASAYPANSKLRNFQSTNQFKRSGDVLMRLSYPVPLNAKLKLTPSVLPIYHLTNDRFTDEQNEKNTITGSQGITLNGNLYFDYQLNQTNSLQLNVGVPFIVRDNRPDGLTRSFVANLEYRIQF
jgi:hypothetical protein